ncbi:MAG: aminoacetone oxidase family FAD-binding enzyme [Desulfuromonas sp.]|nr:MAG: aminoacetone oxidase family FAD-binding enzyme [Desulfuromonas sp.]
MEKVDVIVIGGGPAGIFAAGFAAQSGARVVLLEKNRQCGAKVLITGKGRCNITHSEEDPRKFIEPFGRNGKSFLTALYAFGVRDCVDFFEQRGLPLQQERGGRIFPANGDARAVQKVLQRFLKENRVEVITDCPVKRLVVESGRIEAVETGRGRFSAENYIVATGGLSYPETGCSGDGYRWAAASGHHLVPTRPALVPVKLAEKWTDRVTGINLKNVRVTAWQKEKKLDERFGEAFFTRNGIGGPIILDLSAAIMTALDRGEVTLTIDLKPAVDSDKFDQRLQRELAANSNRNFGNSLGGLLPKILIPLFIELSGIEPEKKCHSVTKEERQRLLQLFKQLPLHVAGCAGYDKAIVTAGGVALPDIDMRSMRSKKIGNLFFAGEMIDLDGPTGGFNLQVCWSTGYLAGINAAQNS